MCAVINFTLDFFAKVYVLSMILRMACDSCPSFLNSFAAIWPKISEVHRYRKLRHYSVIAMHLGQGMDWVNCRVTWQTWTVAVVLTKETVSGSQPAFVVFSISITLFCFHWHLLALFLYRKYWIFYKNGNHGQRTITRKDIIVLKERDTR